MKKYKKSHKNLVRYALDQGMKVGAAYCGEWDLEPCTKFNQIIEALEACDEMSCVIVDQHDKFVGRAYIVNGLEKEEIVADHSDNEFMNKWSDQYYQMLSKS